MTTAATTIKVFMCDDCTWCAAESLEAVRAFYVEIVGSEAEELLAENGEPEELSEADMDAMIFHDFENDTEVKRTFREQLQKEIADGQEFPCMFATTEY